MATVHAMFGAAVKQALILWQILSLWLKWIRTEKKKKKNEVKEKWDKEGKTLQML